MILTLKTGYLYEPYKRLIYRVTGAVVILSVALSIECMDENFLIQLDSKALITEFRHEEVRIDSESTPRSDGVASASQRPPAAMPSAANNDVVS